MIVHYRNGMGAEQLIGNILHLQNLDNEEWEAIKYDGTTLTLRTDRIEGIYFREPNGKPVK